jgi:predicted amidophosphoribosyltransferase
MEDLSDFIDVRELSRAGILKERSVTLRPVLRWPKIVTLRADRYVIQVNLRDLAMPQFIQLSWTPCNYGNWRPWLLCPHCQKRVARLYRGVGYYCRSCTGNFPYESQLRNLKARNYLRAYRLRERLGGSRPVIDPVPVRPFRMWRSTYDRICAEIERIERRLVGSRIVNRAPLLIRPLIPC